MQKSLAFVYGDLYQLPLCKVTWCFGGQRGFSLRIMSVPAYYDLLEAKSSVLLLNPCAQLHNKSALSLNALILIPEHADLDS